MRLCRDRDFYKSFVRICLALMLEQAVILSVNLADNLMLGTYSEAALSGVAAANQIQFVYQQIVYAIGNGVIILGDTLEECIELSSRILVMKDGEISADMDCRTRKPTQLEIVQHMM